MDFGEAYIIARIVERGGKEEKSTKLFVFYGLEKVVKAIRDEIYFLQNYAIHQALKLFPELKEEMYCYLNHGR
jgi:hypothetical protein